MTNLPTPGEAYEAGLREGDKRTVERIAEKLDGICCLQDITGCDCPVINCRDHWLQYLTEDNQ